MNKLIQILWSFARCFPYRSTRFLEPKESERKISSYSPQNDCLESRFDENYVGSGGGFKYHVRRRKGKRRKK